jgi:hypothetical protein
MKLNAWKLSTVVLACALTGVVANSTMHVARADQPDMTDARSKLQDARAALNAAADDHGGHRVKALGLVDQALVEVNAGIEFAREHGGKK